ncbi:RIP metalloprotease RseP [Paramagnetospirillum magneticum]|uniref:Zinc metalloprotease n=1 Tax=Paramagnetospirillum magneticum (strain ATCC 700264 / AMB-1) TaxID=342108 RepID=Q2W4D0_PARM1|nr:RIP metalloprotease RseP [Paramagnetospirillum magneticum]BAE51295.1 Predicted membrane-associated Zn-dependent protease 1 [Paramagnetospirillum magneticum AMB-1]
MDLASLLNSVLHGVWYYVVIFLVILTVVVFVHELGHFLIARWNGVKVEVFSIGFGPEVWGRVAADGTRWRIGLLPLGGYVKMFGDADAASATASDQPMTAEERAQAFCHKRVGQRAAIVVAGPAANFLFAILGLAGMFMVLGQPVTQPVIGMVHPGTAAEAAGLKAGDRITAINGRAVERFQDIQRMVRLEIENELSLSVARGDKAFDVSARPRIIQRKGVFGDMEKVPVLGISADPASTVIVRHGPISALGEALAETENMVRSTFIGIGQMVNGTRDTDELGGPIRIAKGAGEAAQLGLASVVFYTILLSLNLGLINLFPIPILDGGHLMFYAFEAILGRPLGEKAQEYGFRIGLFLVLALMVFATRNDLVSLPVWDMVKRLFS